MSEKQILAVRTADLNIIAARFNETVPSVGVLPSVPGLLEAILAETEFVDRGPAETNPEWKQLIPYVVLCHQGTLLLYDRGGKGGEHRLHTKSSIGIGGHVDKDKMDLTTPGSMAVRFEKELFREIKEETNLTRGNVNSICHLGFVNNDAEEVGKVHLGVLYFIELDTLTGFYPNADDGIINAEFISWHELHEQKETLQLEGWSAIALQTVINHVVAYAIPIDPVPANGPGGVAGSVVANKESASDDGPIPTPEEELMDEQSGGGDGR